MTPTSNSQNFFKRHPDLCILILWAVNVFIFCVLRQRFNEDGIRHLPTILHSTKPILGETRWFFFPSLLFVWLRPWILIGWTTTLESLIRPFLALNFLCGFAYLIGLRKWLSAQGADAFKRAAALLMAGSCIALLTPSSDISEHLIPAAFVITMLAWASTQAAKLEYTKALAIAASGIVLAVLVYEPLIIAILFIPLIVPFHELFKLQRILLLASLLALGPLTILAVQMSAGLSFHAASEQLLLGGVTNTYFRAQFLRPVDLFYALAAFLFGPSQSVIPVEQFYGMRELFHQLKTPGLQGIGLFALTSMLLGTLALGTFVVTMVQKKKFWLFFIYLGIFFLPFMHHQYQYIKFYVFLPVVLALIAIEMNPKLVFWIAGAVFCINIFLLTRELTSDRKLYAEATQGYSHYDHKACWVTLDWIPPISFKWPGSICSASLILATSPHGETFSIEERHRQLYQCFQNCFCQGSAVASMDYTMENFSLWKKLAVQFIIQTPVFENALWRPDSGTKVLDGEKMKIFQYSPEAQKEICKTFDSSEKAGL